MRLQRGVPVHGVEPDLARRIARECRGEVAEEAYLQAKLALSGSELCVALGLLLDGGYLQKAEGPWPGWKTSIRGGALAMASFAKPITRPRAETLLAGVLERAAMYDADDAKPFRIKRLLVFGSYLDPSVDRLGDIDLALETVDRAPWVKDPEALLDYSGRSGRTFQTFTDRLTWPTTEVVMLLKNRSGYISVHLEDIAQFANTLHVVYP